MAGEWVSSCRGVDGDEEERRRRLSEQRKKTAASGGRCGDSGLQRVAPDEGEDDGGPWRHRGAVRWARWPWLGRSHGVGGVRMRGERGGRGAVDLEGRRKYLRGEGDLTRPRGGHGGLTLPRRWRAGPVATAPCSGARPRNRKGGVRGEELGRLGRPGWLRARGHGRWPCGWFGLAGPGGFPPFFVFL